MNDDEWKKDWHVSVVFNLLTNKIILFIFVIFKSVFTLFFLSTSQSKNKYI